MKIYLFRGEKSLSAEMKIVFTELLIYGRNKKHEESLSQVIVCFREKKGLLSCNFSPPTPRMKIKLDHGNPDRNSGHIFICVSHLYLLIVEEERIPHLRAVICFSVSQILYKRAGQLHPTTSWLKLANKMDHSLRMCLESNSIER